MRSRALRRLSRAASLALWLCCAVAFTREDVLVRVVRTDGAPIEATLWAELQEAVAPLGVTLIADDAPVSLVARVRPLAEGAQLELTDAEGHAWQRIVPALGSDELFRETFTQVFLSMIEPSIRAQRERVPVAAHDGFVLRSDLYAGAVLEDREHVTPSLVAALGLVSPRRLHPGLALGLGWIAGPKLAHEGVSGRLNVAALRVRPTLQVAYERRFALELGTPVGIDLGVLHVLGAPSAASTTSRSLRADAIVGGTAALRTRVAARWELLALIGVDVDVNPHSWAIAQGARTDKLIALQRARPYLALGVSWGRSPEAP